MCSTPQIVSVLLESLNSSSTSSRSSYLTGLSPVAAARGEGGEVTARSAERMHVACKLLLMIVKCKGNHVKVPVILNSSVTIICSLYISNTPNYSLTY